MLRQLRLLFGISIFWLALSMLTDGVNTLVLPLQITQLMGKQGQATLLGLATFAGLFAGALIQPYAGALSDRLRPLLGRRGFIGFGLLASLAALLGFAAARDLPALIAAYLGIQVAASVAQAGQQGLIPDLIDVRQRGMASGFKGFADIAGAMVGFALLGQFLGSGRTSVAIAVIGTSLVVAYALAVLLTPEDRAAPQRDGSPTTPFSLRDSYRISIREHQAFARLVVSRFLFLLGIYATGRFLLYFVQDRLGVGASQAAAQAGDILAVLALVTIAASPIGGWLADRIGRLQLMVAGSVLGAAGAALLIFARTVPEMLLYGTLMSLGSAAFSAGCWALLADVVPKQQAARFFGLANFSTAGSAAAAGLLGPLIDTMQRTSAGSGYTLLFAFAALAFVCSTLPLGPSLLKEIQHVKRDSDQGQVRSHPPRLAVLPVPTNPADPEEHQNPPGGKAAA